MIFLPKNNLFNKSKLPFCQNFMKLRFSWLNSRKSLIISSFIDFLLFCYFFFSIFISSISNKPTLLNLTLLNSFIWIISSYIIGRYSNFRRAKLSIFLFQFLKTFLIICLSLLINQVLFRLFWNWNYMNFESFSNFVNIFSVFYLKIYFFSNISQITICAYLYNKFTKKSLWMFWGDSDRKNYLQNLIGKNSIYNIQLLNNKYSGLKNRYAKGIIIDNEEEFAKENIKFIFDLNNKGLKLIKISNWCERYLNRYPS